ncbi:hypothetical protein H5A44_15965 [Pectobacterium brasiliense]|uniref:hypothetical protein n=1 Tax=Pectobacterium brasiliense TaxID=180957 RepID=UPI001969A9A4|nr:hypothetical protein [Pectobacterium brasiliense]MBN3343926.1 hypothetical protein [Pectobacterium brasiliense]
MIPATSVPMTNFQLGMILMPEPVERVRSAHADRPVTPTVDQSRYCNNVISYSTAFT